jgi:ribosomal protein L21E
MTVSMLTHQMIARHAAAMLDEEMPFSTRVNRGREEEFVNAVSGYKKGDTVSIKVPPTSTVYDGATFAGGGSIDVYTETSVSLTLDTQKHTGLTFTAKERTLEISEFKERVLLPKVRSLAATVEADLILRAQKLCPNTVGTAGTTPTTAKTFGAARQLMQEYLAPPGDRTLLISTEANLEMVDASKALFNPAPSIAKMYSEGQLMGMFQGAATFETPNLQAYGNGADITITVNGASQTGSSLTIAGNTALVKGQVFTLPGCYAVHPLTGAATTRLQQFVVTADSSTTSVSIFPPINTSFPNKTVSASPTDGGSLTFVGSASTTYKRSFMFHKDAFTVAFAPLPVLAGCEGYTAQMNGMSVRVQTGGDFTNDTESTRMDVLYGIAAVRGLHACNILQ